MLVIKVQTHSWHSCYNVAGSWGNGCAKSGQPLLKKGEESSVKPGWYHHHPACSEAAAAALLLIDYRESRPGRSQVGGATSTMHLSLASTNFQGWLFHF